MLKNILYFCKIMETGQLAQTAINLLEWSWNISDVIGDPFTSSEWFLETIFQNSIRFRFALILFFFRFVALIRVIKDSNARSSSFWFQFLSALLIILFTPIVGLPLYIAIRPQWWKRDKTIWREILFQQVQECENCGYMNSINQKYCTNCWESLQVLCRECQNKYSKTYSYCPECWAPKLDE